MVSWGIQRYIWGQLGSVDEEKTITQKVSSCAQKKDRLPLSTDGGVTSSGQKIREDFLEEGTYVGQSCGHRGLGYETLREKK